MTELSLLPAELADLSVAQLAALSPQQKILLAQQLDQAGEWLKHIKAWFDAALEQTYASPLQAHHLPALNRSVGITGRSRQILKQLRAQTRRYA